MSELDTMTDEDISALKRDNERLRAIVDKLPKTADGVPVVPGMRTFDIFGFEYLAELRTPPPETCHVSWKETYCILAEAQAVRCEVAAEAAKEKDDE